MATTTLSEVVTTGNSVKCDAGSLDTLNVMDYEDSNTNRQGGKKPTPQSQRPVPKPDDGKRND
eukprot:1431238-Amphidinium_carterae.2